jgi:hypothetical protein
MDVVTAIFEALGGATAIARTTGDPVQTVHSWKASGRIPVWRRAAVRKVRPVPGRELPQDALAYLKSNERDPSSRPTDTQAEAKAA